LVAGAGAAPAPYENPHHRSAARVALGETVRQSSASPETGDSFPTASNGARRRRRLCQVIPIPDPRQLPLMPSAEFDDQEFRRTATTRV
jgi:hypothetical protein